MLYCISFSNEIVPVTNYVNIISIKGLNFDNISELNNDVLVGYYLTNDVLVVTGDLFALFVSDRFPRFTIVDRVQFVKELERVTQQQPSSL